MRCCTGGPTWNPDDGPGVLDDLQALREMGFAIKFFFPKWSAIGYAPERSLPTNATSGWQSLLLETPVPGGWQTLVGLADAVHERGFRHPGVHRPAQSGAGGAGLRRGPLAAGFGWPRH